MQFDSTGSKTGEEGPSIPPPTSQPTNEEIESQHHFLLAQLFLKELDEMRAPTSAPQKSEFHFSKQELPRINSAFAREILHAQESNSLSEWKHSMNATLQKQVQHEPLSKKDLKNIEIQKLIEKTYLLYLEASPEIRSSHNWLQVEDALFHEFSHLLPDIKIEFRSILSQSIVQDFKILIKDPLKALTRTWDGGLSAMKHLFSSLKQGDFKQAALRALPLVVPTAGTAAVLFIHSLSAPASILGIGLYFSLGYFFHKSCQASLSAAPMLSAVQQMTALIGKHKLSTYGDLKASSKEIEKNLALLKEAHVCTDEELAAVQEYYQAFHQGQLFRLYKEQQNAYSLKADQARQSKHLRVQKKNQELQFMKLRVEYLRAKIRSLKRMLDMVKSNAKIGKITGLTPAFLHKRLDRTEKDLTEAEASLELMISETS